MDTLHQSGVHVIYALQSQFIRYRDAVDTFVQLPQYMADPDTLIATVFPLLLAINHWMAARFALAVGAVDMVNNVLKWMLQGERPYWWVKETHQTANLPELQQLPLTCETGAGSPSGHAMTAAAVAFVLISAFLQNNFYKRKPRSERWYWELGLWTAYTLAITFISAARLMLATHFPHQLVMGAVAGLTGGWFICNLPLDRLRRAHFVYATAALFAWACFTYAILPVWGIDPNRSLNLALKHCIDRSYIKLTTTPWHGIYRNSALIIAVGVCITTRLWSGIVQQQLSWWQKLLTAVLSLLISRFLSTLPFPTQPVYIFYPCAFVKNCAIVAVCLLLVPSLISSLSRFFGGKTKTHSYRKPAAMFKSVQRG